MNIERYIVKFLEFKSDKYSHLKRLPRNSRVLDVGCGDCRRLRYRRYFRSDLQQYGVDICGDNRCKQLLKEFHILDIRYEKLPFQDEYFDLIVLSHVIEHLPKDKLIIVIREIRRVLKKRGYLYIEFPSPKTEKFPSGNILKKYTLPVDTFNFHDDETHVSLYSVPEIKDVLEKENFGIDKCGDVREPVKKIFSPFLLLGGYLKRDKTIFTGTLWSLVNWSSYLVARKL